MTLLDLAAHQPVTIVAAPPGSGKTTLLAQWAAAHPRQRVRWLHLGTGLAVAPSFAEDLASALGAGDTAARPFASDRPGAVPDDTSPFVVSLLARLERMSPTTLVIDDFQELTDHSRIDDLATLIDHAPPSLRVIIATQVDPPRHFYRLGLSESLVEVRQEDLAFTREEAADLLRRVSGLQLDDVQVDRLVARTEGWVAGLQLAALSMRDRTDIDEFVTTFAGDDHHVADYLTERVISRQPDAVHTFLLATSVLTRMNGPLCDAATGRTGSQAMLDELHRHHMFINPVDGTRGWYRYHQLFRTLLRHHLHDEDEVLEQQVLRRAAEWHLERDELETAIGYFADAGAWAEVLAVAAAHGAEMRTRGRSATVADWIGMVPQRERPTGHGVTLLEAAAWAVGGEAGAALDALDTPTALGPAEEASAGLLRACALLVIGQPGQAVTVADSTLSLLHEAHDGDLPELLGLTNSTADIRVGLLVLRGTALLHSGLVAEASDALAAVPEGGPAVWQVMAQNALALAAAWSGRLTEAEQTARWALTLSAQCGMDAEPTTADAHLALVEVSRERGDLHQARTALDEARNRSRSARSHLWATILATEEALLTLAEGQPASGLTVLAARQARRPAERPSLPDPVVAWRRSVEARLLMMLGDLEAAASALDAAPLETSDVAAARTALAIDRGDRLAARAVLERWPGEPMPRAGLERRIWSAILLHHDGDVAAAGDELTVVLAEAAPEQHIGLFRTHQVLGPARALYRSTPTPFLRTVVEQPLPSAPRGPVKGMVEQVTERERMVLALLPTRLSNAEIADTLGVSLNTARTHLKHLYRKLGASDRSEAIAVAERLHLL